MKDDTEFKITCKKCGGVITGAKAKGMRQNFGTYATCDCGAIGLDWLKGSEMIYRYIGVEDIVELGD